MDGQLFQFRLLDSLFHFQREITLTVLNKCIYIHNPLDEAEISNPPLDSISTSTSVSHTASASALASASASVASTLSLPENTTAKSVPFQFLNSIHDILLMDLENACHLNNVFQMVTLNKTIYILQSDHWAGKKMWFNWIQYLIYMDRLNIYVELHHGYVRLDALTLEQEKEWLDLQSTLISERSNQLKLDLVHLDDITATLEDRLSQLSSLKENETELLQLHMEAIKKLVGTKEYLLQVEQGDLDVKNEWNTYWSQYTELNTELETLETKIKNIQKHRAEVERIKEISRKASARLARALMIAVGVVVGAVLTKLIYS